MIVFGVASTVFDVVACATLLLAFAARAELFRMSGSCSPFSPNWL
jgi:hypothetical protein